MSFEPDGSIFECILHQGTLYFATQSYDDSVRICVSLWSLPLSGSRTAQPQHLLTLEPGTEVSGLKAREDSLYWLSTVFGDGEESSSLDGRVIERLNLSTGERTQITPLQEDDFCLYLLFLSDGYCVAEHRWDAFNTENDPEKLIWRANSDGSDAHSLFSARGVFGSDGERLYAWMHDWDKTGAAEEIAIYSTDGEKLDSVRFDSLPTGAPSMVALYPTAEDQVLFSVHPKEDPSLWVLYAFPKADIGSGAIKPVMIGTYQVP